VIRWGILSTARINKLVLNACRGSEFVNFVAVASRTESRAHDYASANGIPRSFASYEALLKDPEVDAVYISLPNALHIDWTIRALNAGKHVLCEKPLSRHPLEVEAAFDAAEANMVLLGEALMYRYHPQTIEVHRRVADGEIGELALIRSKHSFILRDAASDFRGSRAMEGGALMDLGCYCVSAARLLAGEPDWVYGRKVLMPSGVDMRFHGVLGFPNSVTAVFDCAMDLPDRGGLEVVGTAGEILVGDPWRCEASSFTVQKSSAQRIEVEVSPSNRYRAEFEQFSLAAMQGRALPFGRSDAVAQASVMSRLSAAAE